MKYVGLAVAAFVLLSAGALGYGAYAQALPYNEKTLVAGERYRIVATAQIPGRDRCQDVANGMWYDHWCLVVREIELVK